MNSSLKSFEIADASVDSQSDWFDISRAESCSLQVGSISPALAGVMKVEVTNDVDLGANDLPDSSRVFTKVDADPLSEIWDLSKFGFKFVRFSWTYTSGAGSLTGNLNCKG